MTLNIISADNVMFSGEVTSVTLPGTQGSFTVLRDHASLISTLNAGTVTYRLPSGEEAGADIRGGLVDVHHNVVSVCVY